MKKEKTVENQQHEPTPEEVSKSIGQNLLYFLNKQGVAPMFTEETMEEFQVWQQICQTAINLKAGTVLIIPSEIVKEIKEEKND